MNKKRFLKALMFALVMAIAIGFVANGVMAQQVLMMSQLSVGIPTANNPDAYLVDNFEYWNSPRNMGWMVLEPPYPVFGAGLGYGRVETVLDFEEGSKVLDVFRPPSVFLLGTQYMDFTIMKGTQYADGSDQEFIPGAYSRISLKVRAPMAFELFETFRVVVNLEVGDAGATDGENIVILMVPRESNGSCTANGADCVAAKTGSHSDEVEEGDQITLFLGRQFADGTWHLVEENLDKAVDNFYDEDKDVIAIKSIMLMGDQYRVDDIKFAKRALSENRVPELFRIGPVYASLFQTYDSRYVFAEDLDLGITMVRDEDNPGYVMFPNVKYQSGAQVIPYIVSLSCSDIIDPDGNPMAPDPNEVFLYTCDCPDPIQSDCCCSGDLEDCTCTKLSRTDDCVQDVPTLDFIFTMGDTVGPIANIAAPIPIALDPNAGMDYFSEEQVQFIFPPYLMQQNGVLVINSGTADMTNPMFVLAAALYNSGYDRFPNVVRMFPAQGQVFEDMVVTCRVTDGIAQDKETFPISIVNYQVDNFPPLLNDLEDVAFYVNEMNTYQVVAADPDLEDMGRLIYHATLNGIPNYSTGTMIQSVINETTGLIAFVPFSEGALHCVVTVSDPRGLHAIGELTIFCANPGTWLNHPPIVLGDLDTPQTVRAGQTFVASEMNFFDPDGDQLYWSCNIGAVGKDGVYTFQTQFPGYYLVQITAYDIRGAAATTEFVLHVIPWWSM